MKLSKRILAIASLSLISLFFLFSCGKKSETPGQSGTGIIPTKITINIQNTVK